MSHVYVFGKHAGMYPARADQIAKKYGAAHVNLIVGNGNAVGWFTLQVPQRETGKGVAEMKANMLLDAISSEAWFRDDLTAESA